MHVAVIGGSFHVGPFVVKVIEAGHRVSVYNRGRTKVDLPPQVERVTVDRKVPGQIAAALREHKPDAVIDMIAFTTQDVEEVVTALPDMRHYVFCGSTVVYGVIGKTTPSEDSPVPEENSGYGLGKVACEQLMARHERENGLRYTSMRLAHPYGPGDHMLYLTGRESLFLDRMRKGRTILIPGSGDSRIHAIYAGDAARAFVYVLDRPECFGNIYNLAADDIMTMDEYFESIARVLGVPLVARHVPNDWFRDNAGLWKDWKRNFDFGYNWVHYESAFDVTRLREIGFKCREDHDSGTALMMEWLDRNGLVEASSDNDEEEKILAVL